MKAKILFLFFFIVASFVKAQTNDDSSVLYLTFKNGQFRDKHKKKTLLWRFHNSDSTAFASAGYDDSKWLRLRSEITPDEAKKHNIKNRSSWFRLKVKADSSALNKAVVLRFEGYGTMYVYQDGTIIDSIADGGMSVSLKNYGIFTSLTDTHVHTWAIRYYSTFEDDVIEDDWGFEFYLTTGATTLAELKDRFLTSSYYFVTLGSLFATLFIVHLLLFIFYRKDLSNLYFALFSLCFTICLFGFYEMLIGNIGSSKTVGYLIGIPMIFSCFCLVSFSSYLFSKKKYVSNTLLVLGVILLSYIIFVNDEDGPGYYMALLIALSLMYSIFLFVRAMFRKVPGSYILGIGVLITISFFLILIIQGLTTGKINFSVTAGKYSFIDYLKIGYLIVAVLSMPLSITAFLAWRFSSTTKNLNKQLITVETLSAEKQSILENQNARLENEVAVRTKEIAEEKQRSDELLLNILPQEVAEELKLNGYSKAHRYDEVSVLFTDFVNFTKISEQLGVEELLNELNINFTAFDKIMERHGLEKIKTIGDAYLAVCGLPVNDERHAQNTVNAALDILEFVQKRKQEVPYGLDIRIGINSGSLIAGIIGVKKFAYDIWGDTVNTAARMEQSSLPGKINISEATYNLVKNDFICTARGKLQAKGKGEMEMYFVERKNDE